MHFYGMRTKNKNRNIFFFQTGDATVCAYIDIIPTVPRSCEHEHIYYSGRIRGKLPYELA